MRTSIRSIIFCTLLFITTYRSAAFHYAGKHFYYSHPGLFDVDTAYISYLSPKVFAFTFASKHRATVQLHFRNTRYGQLPDVTIVVPPRQAVKYYLTGLQIMAIGYTLNEAATTPPVVTDKNMEITSDSDIVVHYINEGNYVDDGSELLPVDNQPDIATKYRIIGYAWPGESNFERKQGVSIVATCDNIKIRITPACPLEWDAFARFTHLAGIPYTVALNKGQTYLVQSFGPYDLTGTEIEVINSPSGVNMPISVLYQGASLIPDNSNQPVMGPCCLDLISEQMLPVNWWDTLVPVVPLYKQNLIRLRVFSDVNGNRVFFDNNFIKVLNSGEFIDTLIEKPLVVHASKPVGVGNFMLSIDDHHPFDSSGDPDMLWVMGASQGFKESYFKFFGRVYNDYVSDPNRFLYPSFLRTYKAALTIISPASNVRNIRYDTSSIDTFFHPFPGDSSWQYARIPIDTLDTAVHHIISPQRILVHFSAVYIWGGYSFNLSEMGSEIDSHIIYKCPSEGVTLTAPAGYDAYRWNTGDTAHQIYVTSAGHYQVKTNHNSVCDNNIYDYYVRDSSQQQSRYVDTLVCFTDKLLLQLDTSGWEYVWDDGTTASSRTVRNAGIYTVHYYTPSCVYHTDTFRITFYNKILVVGNNQRDCNRKKDKVWVVMAPGDTTTYIYTWLDSAEQILRTTKDNNGDTFYVPRPGMYSLIVQVPGGCSLIIPFTVLPPVEAAFIGDSIICLHDTANFHSTAVGNIAKWYWDFGDGDTSSEINPTHIYKASGIYKTMQVVSDTMPCTDTAYATIKVTPPPYVSFTVDKDSICVGEPVTLTPVYDVEAGSIMWDINGSRSVRTGIWKHSFDKSGEEVITLIGSYLYCKEVRYTDTIHVWPLPVVNLRTDTSLCPNQTPVLLMNLVSVPEGSKYLWNTGEQTASIMTFVPGEYWLAVTTTQGCTATDSVLLSRSCYIAIPNVFSPNGDGVNDYFFPRDLLGAGISSFGMRIYNRWGEMIFETNRPDGHGWDGMLNGVPQGEGVFVYAIEVSYTNGVQEKYKGNVTLIR